MKPRKYGKRLRLGDLLVQNNMIKEKQLKEALSKQKVIGKKLGEVLIDLGFVTQEDIIRILEMQLGIEYADLDNSPIDTEAVNLIPENIAKRDMLIPISIKGNDIIVAMEDPLNIYAMDDVRIYTGMNVVPALEFKDKINKAINIYYGNEQALKAAEEYKQEQNKNINTLNVDEKTSVDELVKSAPIVKLVNTMLQQAVRTRASDVHIEPLEDKIRIRYRIDGRLKEMMTYEKTLMPAITARVKITSGMNIAEKRKPQDGRIGIKVDNREYDIRVSTLPTIFGEKIVMRITDKKGLSKNKTQLGLFEDDLFKLDEILKHKYGIILVTGPTGSGKSTTLYTVLSELNKEDINIITVEDPVEANIDGINQVQVNQKAGLTFESSLRSILRQDPDIIMIGEIRDKETAQIAVKASITGHLVLSTLHTNDAPSSVTRLIDMGIEPFLIGASVVGIIAQRLIRKLCPHCKQKYIASDFDMGILDLKDEKREIYKAKGCHICNYSGYLGRTGIYEIMTISKELRELINSGANTDKLKNQALLDGMKTLKDNGAKLVVQGVTSVEELLNTVYVSDKRM